MRHQQMTPANPALPYDPMTNPMYPPAAVETFVPEKGREWERYLTQGEHKAARWINTASVFFWPQAHDPDAPYVDVILRDGRRIRACCIIHPGGAIGTLWKTFHHDQWWCAETTALVTSGYRYGDLDVIARAIVMDWLAANGRGILA